MRLEHASENRNRPSTNGSSQNGSSPHTNGSSGKNGADWDTNGVHAQNSDLALSTARDDTPYCGHNREEVTRILLQALSDMGYHHSADQLSHESGCDLELPSVAAFRAAVQHGEWDEAEALLFGQSDHEPDGGGVVLRNGDAEPDTPARPHGARQVGRILSGGQNGHTTRNGLPLGETADVPSLQFLLRQQKYLELLERRDLSAAMSVLRNELTPLKRDTGRIHLLSSLLMCQSAEELRSQANWDGSQGTSRSLVLSELSKSISPSVMIPEHRLASLFSAIQHEQVLECRFHNTITPPSLYTDHECTADDFPMHTLTELRGHTDEVWYLEFSRDGTMLATAGKDGVVCVYEYPRWKLLHEFREHERSANGASRGVSFIAFSPDSQYLISCSKNLEVVVLNVRDGRRAAVIDHFDYPPTSAAWLPDSQTFVVGAQSALRPLTLYSMRPPPGSSAFGLIRNNEIHSFGDAGLWEGHAEAMAGSSSYRVGACAVSSDGERLAVTTIDNRLLVFDIPARRRIAHWSFDDRLTSVAFAPDDPRELLVSMNEGRVLALSAVTGEILVAYEGARQKEFVLRSSYGGATNQLIVSGSEDSTIHIWRRELGTTVAVLDAHAPGTVNAIAWHPTNPDVFASAGDDRRVRIWTSASAMRAPAPSSATIVGVTESHVQQ